MAVSEWTDPLTLWGCDTVGALRRLLQDNAFYLECLTAFHQDHRFALLGRQLREGDVAGAFSSAHALKGAAANLGLTPLYHALCPLVEQLRMGEMADAALYTEVMAQYQRMGDCLQKLPPLP